MLLQSRIKQHPRSSYLSSLLLRYVELRLQELAWALSLWQQFVEMLIVTANAEVSMATDVPGRRLQLARQQVQQGRLP